MKCGKSKSCVIPKNKGPVSTVDKIVKMILDALEDEDETFVRIERDKKGTHDKRCEFEDVLHSDELKISMQDATDIGKEFKKKGYFPYIVDRHGFYGWDRDPSYRLLIRKSELTKNDIEDDPYLKSVSKI